ncbi:hypothetical protein [Pseudomonas aeruginosa]|uniref:hypothetical protein n=1 Tax=Pseudomonas aeruginosa TaxID=287 RepID=UPI001FB6B7BE|nr:hypothetical protein [Pseudomonas aeruginosa]
MNKANECTCPSGDGSLVHPCPAHPAVEKSGGDERDLQGAQGERDGWGPLPIVQVPWNVFDRAVMWVEDRRRYGDDGTIVDDWKALKTIQRAALAQPSQSIAAAPTYQFQSREIGESDWAPCDFRWYLYCSKSPEMDTRVVEVAAQPSPAQVECIDCHSSGFCMSISNEEIRCPCGAPIKFSGPAQAEGFTHFPELLESVQQMDAMLKANSAQAERPEVVAYADPIAFATFKKRGHEGGVAGREWMWAEPSAGLVAMSRTDECECIIGELRSERDAAQARVAELEKELAMARDAASKGDAARHAACGMEMDIQELRENAAKLAAFAQEIISGALEGGNFDGADLQESAERHGIIAKQVMNEPCRGPEEYCACAWSTSFPTECYRITAELRALLSEQEGGNDVSNHQ